MPKAYNASSWVVALDSGVDGISVCVVYDTEKQARNHKVPEDLKPKTIVCSLKEAKKRGFLYTDPYDPNWVG